MIEVPLKRPHESLKNEKIIGILFVMTVPPQICPAPFADTDNEILFSMYPVFRLDKIISQGGKAAFIGSRIPADECLIESKTRSIVELDEPDWRDRCSTSDE